MTSVDKRDPSGRGRVVATAMDLVRGVGQLLLDDGRVVKGPIGIHEHEVGNLAAVLAPRGGREMLVTTKQGETRPTLGGTRRRLECTWRK